MIAAVISTYGRDTSSLVSSSREPVRQVRADQHQGA